jgi:fibronectin-binding autotransporter adhesin
VLSGAAGFTKAGTGALLLYASNTYAGVTVVSNGPSSQTSAALWLRNYAALGTNQVQLRNPAAMTALYFPAAMGNGTLVNPIELNNATNNTTRITTDEANTFIATLSGVISGGHVTSELLFDNDSGTTDAGRTRLGNPGNTFVASRLRVNRGGLAIGSDGALGDAQNDLFLDVTESGVGSGLNVESDGVTLGSNRGVTINSISVIQTDTNRLTIAGPLFGGGELVKRGEGTLTLAGLNSHSGALNITNGTVRIGDGGLTGNFGTGPIRNNGQLVADTEAELTFGNTLSGTGGLVKTGSGLLGLTGARTYSGPTVISNGTLAVYGTHSGGQYYLVHPPGVLAGNGTVNSEALVAGIVRPGPTNALTVTNLTAGFLARLQVFGGGTGAILRVTGTNGLTVPAGSDVVRVDVLGLPPAVGTFTVLNYEGAVQGGAATNVVLGDFPPRAAMTLAENAGNTSIDLTVTDLGERIKWTGATDALWDRDDTTNWVTEAGGVPTAYLQDLLVGDRVRFDDSAIGNFSVTVADPVNPAELVVSNELNDYTISGDAIGGSAGLVKQGAAALTLGSSNAFEGATQVEAGRLAIARADALGTAPGLVVSNQLRLAAGATLAFNNAIELEPTRGIVLGTPLNASPVVLDAGPFGSTIRGPLGNEAGATGVLRKIGAGPVALTAAGTFSGDTIISAGALVLANGGALGGAGTVRLGDFTSGTNAVGIYVDPNATHVSQTFARPITVSADGTGPVTIGSMVEAGTPTLVAATFSGAITLSNRSVTLRSGAGDFTAFNGALQGTGDVTVANGGLYPDVGRGWGGNRLGWGVVAKTFVGNLTIQGGTAASPTILQINLADSIPNSATVTVENAAVLRLNANETLGVLAGPGRVRGVVAVRTLTLGVNNESYSFGGVLENDPTLDAGSLNLAKVGTGTLTLTGTNTYTAGTAISGGGVLSVDLIADTGDSRLGYPGAAGAGYIGIREATLRYTGAGSNSTTRYLWLDQSATNNVFDVSQAAAQLHLYPSGGTRNQPWVKQGAGTLTIGAGAWSGATTVSNGTLRLSDVSAFNGNLQVDSTLAITSTIPFATKWLYSGTLGGTGMVIKSGAGVFQFTRTNALAGTLLITQGLVGNDATNADWSACTADVNVFPGAVLDLRADAIRMDALHGAGLITNSFGPGGTEATNILVLGVNDGDGLFIGPIFGSGAGTGGENQGRIALHKVGAGTQALGGTMVYAGPTWVSNGTLSIGGTLSSSSVEVVNGATLAGNGTIQLGVRSAGTVYPSGAMTAGSYTQEPTGTFSVDIGGVVPGLEHGKLTVVGTAYVDGVLSAALDGFTPAAGQVFTVLTASVLSGTFATTNLPALDPGLGWDVVYAGSAVSLVVTGGVPVLTAYEQWAQSIPNPAERGEQADPDGDGYANLLEYSQGTDATNSADHAKLSLVRSNGQFLVLFNRVNAATDIVYEVEGAYLPTNNATWLGIATNVIGSWGSSTNVNDNNTAAVHRVLVTDLLIGTNRSLRLKVTRP